MVILELGSLRCILVIPPDGGTGIEEVAAKPNYVTAIKLLLQRCLDLAPRDFTGNTTLHQPCPQNFPKTKGLEALKAVGADAKAPNFGANEIKLARRPDDFRLEAILKLHKMSSLLGARCESMFIVSLRHALYTSLRGVMEDPLFSYPLGMRLSGIFHRVHHQWGRQRRTWLIRDKVMILSLPWRPDCLELGWIRVLHSRHTLALD